MLEVQCFRQLHWHWYTTCPCVKCALKLDLLALYMWLNISGLLSNLIDIVNNPRVWHPIIGLIVRSSGSYCGSLSEESLPLDTEREGWMHGALWLACSLTALTLLLIYHGKASFPWQDRAGMACWKTDVEWCGRGVHTGNWNYNKVLGWNPRRDSTACSIPISILNLNS